MNAEVSGVASCLSATAVRGGAASSTLSCLHRPMGQPCTHSQPQPQTFRLEANEQLRREISDCQYCQRSLRPRQSCSVAWAGADVRRKLIGRWRGGGGVKRGVASVWVQASTGLGDLATRPSTSTMDSRGMRDAYFTMPCAAPRPAHTPVSTAHCGRFPLDSESASGYVRRYPASRKHWSLRPSDFCPDCMTSI